MPISPQPDPAADRDRETARLLIRGDAEGLRRLLTDHVGRVRWSLRREFHAVLDESSIDEALSQASQRAWQAGHRYEPARGTLRAWFYVIARNCTRRVLECRRRQRTLALQDDLDAAATPASLPDPEDVGAAAAPGRQRVADLYRCIDALPPQQRAVILADLRADGAAPTDDLARQLRTTPNSIYVARANGRKALRAALQALGHAAGASTETSP